MHAVVWSREGKGRGTDNVRALIQGNRDKFHAGEDSEQKKVSPAGSLIESGVVSNSALKGDTLMSEEERRNFPPYPI